MNRFRMPIVAVCVLALTACGNLARMVFAPPIVTFRALNVESLGLTGGRLVVTLQLANPNAYALSATGARYQLYTRDSVLVGQGESHDQVRVPGHDAALVRLPITVSWSALGAAGADMASTGAASYRIVGDVQVFTPLGSYPVPLNARGIARAPVP